MNDSHRTAVLIIYASFFAGALAPGVPILAIAPIVGTIVAFVKMNEADAIWRSHFDNQVLVGVVSVISAIVLLVMAYHHANQADSSWPGLQQQSGETVFWWWVILLGSSAFCLYRTVKGGLRALESRPVD